jgi:hypothetical protein
MEILKHFLEFLHFLGFSGLIGGGLAQIRVPEKTVTRVMMDGAWTQLVTGLLLVAVNEPDVNHAKVGIKLVVLLVIVYFLFTNRKKTLESNTFFTVLGLSIFNMALALFWVSGK